MKIMFKKEFDRMPVGTVFAEFKPYIFGQIMIKNSYIDDEFWNGATDLIPDLDYIEDLWLKNVEKSDGEKIGTEKENEYYIGTTEETENTCWDCSSADYNDNDLFVVFEEYEVKRMINILQETLKDS